MSASGEEEKIHNSEDEFGGDASEASEEEKRSNSEKSEYSMQDEELQKMKPKKLKRKVKKKRKKKKKKQPAPKDLYKHVKSKLLVPTTCHKMRSIQNKPERPRLVGLGPSKKKKKPVRKKSLEIQKIKEKKNCKGKGEKKCKDEIEFEPTEDILDETEDLGFKIDGLIYLEGIKFDEVSNYQLRRKLADRKVREKLVSLGLVNIFQ